MRSVLSARRGGFFIATGRATSTTSQEHASLLALKQAGIAHLNLMRISIPGVIRGLTARTQAKVIPAGAVVWALVESAEAINEGLRAVAVGTALASGKGTSFRVANTAAAGSEREVRDLILEKLSSKALALELDLGEVEIRVEVLEPRKGQFGSAVAVFGIFRASEHPER